MMVENFTIAEGGKKVIELTEVFDEQAGYNQRSTNGKNQQQRIVIDGRGYEHSATSHQRIHDLTEVVEDNDLTPQVREAVLKLAADAVEKIAHDIVRTIAERVIHEELEKIKGTKKGFWSK